MNSYDNYQAQYVEAISEDPEGTQKFLESEREKAYESYPEGKEVVYCDHCGEPLRYMSISYQEGCHIDSCL